MQLDGHLGKLREKHAVIEKEIDEESHRPAPNTMRITELKRQKLKLKEEISRFAESY